MEALLRQDIAQLASRIGERNLKRYEALCEAATFIEQSFEAAGHGVMRQRYEAR